MVRSYFFVHIIDIRRRLVEMRVQLGLVFVAWRLAALVDKNTFAAHRKPVGMWDDEKAPPFLFL